MVGHPESASQWHSRVADALARDGHRDPEWERWSSWPFAGSLEPRPLAAPAATEPARGGAGGLDCFLCREAADPGDPDAAPGLFWWDEEWMLGAPHEGSSLPFAAFLMPRRHADLSDLTPAEASRMGELLHAVEQVVVAVLDVPRLQVARWGDGQEHLHWWLMGRPTGALQLRGTFLALWDDLLPLAPTEITTASLALVAAGMVERVGGSARKP